MTKQEKYELAKWAIKYALDNGADDAKVTIANSSGSSIDVRDEKIDKLEQSIESGLSISLYVNNRYSAASTNRLNKAELEMFIKQAIESAQYLAEDEYRKLPRPELYYKGGGKDLKVYDPKINSIEPEDKIRIVKALEQEVLGSDDRIISVTASYFDGFSSKVMVTSNGFEGDSESTYFGVGASVSVKSGEARPSAGWYETSVHFDNFKKEGAAKVALKKALAKIGQQKLESEKLPMLVENEQIGRILNPLISALNGSAIQQKNSFLLDKKGEKVISSKLTIADDPTIESARASKHFDGEGMAAVKRPVFTKGVLDTYFINTYYANKMGVEPTTGGTSNLIFDLGNKDLQGLIKTMKRGILVTGFNGGNANPTSGDFSYGIEGFLVENGKLSTPVNEMNITGNMLTLWSNVEEVGNDPELENSWRTPSIIFNDVEFSGM